MTYRSLAFQNGSLFELVQPELLTEMTNLQIRYLKKNKQISYSYNNYLITCLPKSLQATHITKCIKGRIEMCRNVNLSESEFYDNARMVTYTA